MALFLSERGVGSLESILRMRTDLAMDAWHYHQFKIDFAAAEAKLAKKEASE